MFTNVITEHNLKYSLFQTDCYGDLIQKRAVAVQVQAKKKLYVAEVETAPDCGETVALY